uniref:Disease resistance protein At4g27190-like leucine-rich repeats domain-containing protein n=1 Tax=Cucumis melo TaxID=3656 RepID=A0A9I9EBS9_CUCME
MQELNGLELKMVKISLSPPSPYTFANIRLLRLHECELGSIDIIGELKKLEVLDFSESNITQIPSTMSQLTKLKLTKQEELSLETFDRWEGEEYEGRKNASLSELRYLPHLYALKLTIQDEEIMPKDLFSRELNLKKFNIYLDLYDNSEFQHFVHENKKPLQKCLSKLEYLILRNSENLESIIHGYHGESTFNNLKNVIIRNCNKLKTLFFNCTLDDILNLEEIVINSCEKIEVTIIVKENEETTNHIELTHLKYLYLISLPQLHKFCSKSEKCGQLTVETSTSNTISIGESLFSEEASLPNLEKLKICSAKNLKMIWSNNVLIPNFFSKLKEVDQGNLCKQFDEAEIHSVLRSFMF